MKTDYVVVTDWEKVEKDDFYLSKDWEEEYPEEVKQARELQEEGKLFVAYIVAAVNFAIYSQMDAAQIFIDRGGNEILRCETAIINREKMTRWEYEG